MTESILTRRQALAGLAGLLAYFSLWAALPVALAASFPLDVVEGIYWGHEWQWGYYKHPPLSSWLLYVFFRCFGALGPYLLGQLCVALALWLTWRLGRRVLEPPQAALGSALLLAVFYYTLPSLEFNHNLAQLPVWAGFLWAFHVALTERNPAFWLLLGALAGLGLMVKYSVAVLLAAAGLFMLATPARRLLRTPGPWLALAAAALVFSPHALWLAQHDWLPFVYAHERALEAGHGGGRGSALNFLGAQAASHAPLALLALLARARLRWPAAGGADSRPRRAREDLLFVWFMGLAPALLLTLAGLALGVGLHDQWGMPMWGLSGLMLASLLPRDPQALARQGRRLLAGLAVWLAALTAAMAALLAWGAQWRGKPSRMDWPQAALAQAVQAQWQALSRCPLDSVSGDGWLSGLAASALPGPPSVMVEDDPAYSPWMNARRVQRCGSLMLWPGGGKTPSAPLLEEARGLAVREGQWQLPWGKLPGREPLRVRWRAYIPAACLKQD